MKKNLFLFGILLLVIACSEDPFVVDYTPPVAIHFQEVDENNIITVAKGTMDYTASIEVHTNAESKISSFEIFHANVETGAIGALIEGTSQFFEEGTDKIETTLTIDNLVENKCIKVVVTDISGSVFERNLLVQITPSVIFSQPVIIETVENYYGPYYASWHGGRVYMRSDAEYKDEIDFSFGDIPNDDADDVVPALVNPAKRSDYDLLTISGLQDVRFALTDLTRADYDNISRVDPSLINSLADPSDDVVEVEAGKVYLFKTTNGKKGLIHVSQLNRRIATIEVSHGEWVNDTPYHQLSITSKVVAE